MPMNTDSIVALSTPTGAGGVAVIRLSGTDAIVRAAAIISRKSPPRDRRACVANVKDPSTGEIIDRCLILAFRAPNSFTGENVVEIQCHGGPYIVQRILKACLSSGFRAAEPGEFTRRAVLNGKMDLTEAEGLRELIEAQTEQEWRAGKQLSEGHLKKATIELRQKLLEALAYLEARIDFPDEGDTAGVSLQHVTTRVETARKALAHLASTYASGRVSAEGLRVCLLGAPNAGKSSLMNALLGHDRAIVSEIPGTTRDYIDEKCLVSGRLIRLIDMAGLRETADLVEQLGVARAKELARQADIILLVTPSEDATQDKAAIVSWIKSESLPDPIVIVTKIDLKTTNAIPQDCIGVSNLTGEGLDELRKRLAAEVDQRLGSLRNEAAWLTNARHLDCVERAKGRLDTIMDRIQPSGGDEDEILAFELREATQALGLLIGEVYADDVLDVVFSSFCIGK